MKTTRPVGITFSALVLLFASLAALTGLFVIHLGLIFTIATFLYGVTGLISAYGLWKMRPWGGQAFLLWAVISLLDLVMDQYTVGQFPILFFIAYMLFFVLILSGLYWYIYTKIKSHEVMKYN